MASCLQESEGGLSQAELDNLTPVGFCLASNTSAKGTTTAPSGGLLQAELDNLVAGGDDVTDRPSSPEDFEDLLLRTRRTRRFVGSEAADALIMNAMLKAPSAGLSQDELDALNVSAREDADKPSSPEGSEELLFRVRRRRHFMGDEAADAFALDTMTKMPEATSHEKYSSDETATSASGSSSLPSGGLSQAELDALSICAGEEPELPCSNEGTETYLFQVRRRRHFMGREQADALVLDTASLEKDAGDGSLSLAAGGLSQAELDALTVGAEEASEPGSPEGSEAFLLRVRRARHFLGEEAAAVLVLDATSKMPVAKAASEETESTASGGVSLTASAFYSKQSSDLSTGLSQEELDALCISANEEPVQPCSPNASQKMRGKMQNLYIDTMSDDISPAVSPKSSPDISPRIQQVATPQRKRGNGIRLPSSPELA